MCCVPGRNRGRGRETGPRPLLASGQRGRPWGSFPGIAFAGPGRGRAGALRLSVPDSRVSGPYLSSGRAFVIGAALVGGRVEPAG